MGKATGFMEFNRKNCNRENPLSRVNHWNEFEVPLTEEERREQGARCMDCGVPFCQSGVILNGMATGCPLHNLIPEWNNLIYLDKWELGLERLLKTSNFPEFTSRVCPALCENACTCGLNGESVTVKANEKYLIWTMVISASDTSLPSATSDSRCCARSRCSCRPHGSPF